MNTAKQTAMDFDFRARDPVMHEHTADFTKMKIGVMAGDECRVIRCPACGRNCVAKQGARGWQFIHNASIQSTTRRVRFAPVVYCALSRDEVRLLVGSGHVIRNRKGQILEVRQRPGESQP